MPGDREPDPFTVLNVARSATKSEIRAAYRALVKKYHPDLHQGNPLAELASARLAEINRAYEVLSDPKRRASHGAPEPATPGRPAAARTPPTKRLVATAILLLLLPVGVRLAAAVMRGLAGVARALFEATGALRGGRLAAAAALACAVVAAVLLRRRRAGRGGPPHGDRRPPP